MGKFLGLVCGCIVGWHLIGMMGLGTKLIAKKYGYATDLPTTRELVASRKLPRATSGIVHNVLVTAYDGHDAECIGAYRASLPEPHVTAKEVNVDVPGIAADFDAFPPGTEITILQLGETFTVDDTGQAMQDDAERGIPHLDLRMPAHYGDERSPEEARHLAHQRAKQFGVQFLTILVKLPDGR